MANIISNPFVTGGYAGAEYFCDRKKETSQLMSAINSSRNVCLLSLRRMGKTGLLQHVKNQLESGARKEHPWEVIYVDLMPTMNGSGLLNVLASAVLRAKNKEKNLFERFLSLLASLRPGISFDSLTGNPSVELKVESPAEIQLGLEHLLKFSTEIKHNLVFMLDEFQQITQYPEINTEQILRSILQQYPTVPFIFSGSSKHMLEPMFSAANRPFYQSSEMMYLEEIPALEYADFIRSKFSDHHKKIDAEALERIFFWSRMHTYYVQHICNVLFETGSKKIDLPQVNGALHKILIAHETLFVNYRNLLPNHQFKLLQAIAIEEKVTKPTSGAFIREHRLTSPSSVMTSLKALAEKEMIVQTGIDWKVYDVFFSRWLQYQYGKK